MVSSASDCKPLTVSGQVNEVMPCKFTCDHIQELRKNRDKKTSTDTMN